MESVLAKLFKWNNRQASEEILNKYQKEWFSIVNFIYFAVVVAQKLFDTHKKTTIQKDYKKFILKSDFLLPDWIALQFFYFFARLLGVTKEWTYTLSNLNWTDFVPYFLDYIKTKFGNQKICLLMYWTHDNLLEKAKDYITYKWYNVVYAQNWFSEFNRQKAKNSLNDYMDTINILLLARSTPQIPIQELWTADNIQFIKENRLLVINTWWLFDFWAWEQKRAPLVFRKAKLEWLWRLLTDPKRNFVKVYNSLSCFWYVFRYLVLKKS